MVFGTSVKKIMVFSYFSLCGFHFWHSVLFLVFVFWCVIPFFCCFFFFFFLVNNDNLHCVKRMRK